MNPSSRAPKAHTEATGSDIPSRACSGTVQIEAGSDSLTVRPSTFLSYEGRATLDSVPGVVNGPRNRNPEDSSRVESLSGHLDSRLCKAKGANVDSRLHTTDARSPQSVSDLGRPRVLQDRAALDTSS